MRLIEAPSSKFDMEHNYWIENGYYIRDFIDNSRETATGEIFEYRMADIA